jgi:hypothetical protein
MRHILYSIAALLLFTACEKPPAREDIQLPPAQEGGIFMLNEGTYNSGNSSITFYDFKEKTLTDDVFKTANNRPLGDVLQSLTIHNGKAYVVVNNSKKIEVINTTTFVSEGIISGFNSPRYIAFVDNNKAYVSDLYDNAIAVVDINSKTITGKIPCGGATEEMILLNGKAYVCNTKRNYLYVVNSVTDLLEDSIELSYGSNSIVQDKNNMLWVLCSGDPDHSINAGIYKVNPLTNDVEFSINNMPPTGIFGATRLVINGSKNMLYWLNTDVFSLDINATALPAQPFVKSNNNKFYGLGADPVSGDVYMSDAIDFVQRSNTYRYNSAGTYKGVFKTGISTNSFYFYYK